MAFISYRTERFCAVCVPRPSHTHLHAVTILTLHFSFSVRLMQEGRMKGQAFVGLPSQVKAETALKEVHGYILQGKPMVVVGLVTVTIVSCCILTVTISFSELFAVKMTFCGMDFQMVVKFSYCQAGGQTMIQINGSTLSWGTGFILRPVFGSC